MQVKKDDIYNKILNTARKEFLEKGFKDTSMRSIANKTDVNLSNIYNYFKNKDMIFKEILKPAIEAIDNSLKNHNRKSNLTIDIFNSQEYVKKETGSLVELIRDNKDELKILLFEAHGSLLEDFKEKFIEKHTKMGLEYLRLMKEKYNYIEIDISDFFIHTMSSWWISIIGELVTHDLSKEKMERFISEYIIFATAGWKKIMKVN